MFFPSRKYALERLNEFAPNAGSQYEAYRNFDYGPSNRDNISALSPYIRHRVITEQEVLCEVLKHHTAEQASKFIQEVFWRTYWKGWLEMRPSVWYDYINDCKINRHSIDDSISVVYQKAIAARSGINCFDTWVNELVEFGYLHNHARMWFASIWIFTLKLPWQLGAEFFYQNLLDADPASNTLSWRWVAGLQTKGKAYIATAENIKKYTNERFNPVSQLATSYSLPVEQKEYQSNPLFFTNLQAGSKKKVVLIHEEDLCAEIVSLCTEELDAVVFLQQQTSQFHSKHVSNFKNELLQDARKRINKEMPQVRIGVLPDLLENSIKVIFDELALSKNHHIICVRPHVGYLKDKLSALESFCDHKGVSLSYIDRKWDSNAFPFATKGFFNFKKNIPKLIEGSLDESF